MNLLIRIILIIMLVFVYQSCTTKETLDPNLKLYLDVLVNPDTFGPDIINKLYDIEINTSNADQIYVDLTDYDLGAGGGECLAELITKRGKRIIPLLEKKMKQPLFCPPKYKSRCISSIELRNREISDFIAAINKGIVLCPDYNDCPKMEN